MKKNLILVLFLSIFLFLTGCSLKTLIPSENESEQGEMQNEIIEEKKEEKEESSNTLIYENKIENFSFEFFKDWTFKENQLSFNTVVFTPEDDEIKENVGISVQKLQKFLSVQEYYEETIYELQNSLIGFKEISSQDISQGGMTGKTIVYEHDAENIKLKSQQTFLMGPNNTVYSINYTATKKTFDKFIEGAQLIINSFQVNNNQ